MTLESVVTRLGIPTDRPFHDALSDTLYTADVCRKLDLEKGLAEYPTEEETLRASLCHEPGDYRDFKVFRGFVDKEANQKVPAVRDTPCPECGTILKPDEIWLKRGSNAVYTLCQCPNCSGKGGPASKGVMLRFKSARRDGLHWAFARCTEIPDKAKLAQWNKQRAQTIERIRRRAEKTAQETK